MKAAGPDANLVVRFDEKQIDEIFHEVNQCLLPGAAVGIALHGVPVYRKGVGLASMELAQVLTPSMRMRIGSTTKQFTAFTYLLLCEAGLAGIDDALGTYLPELNPVARAVTMRQLMTNTSGLRDATDVVVQFSGVLSGESVSSADILRLYEDMDDENAPPGSTFIYNNGAWMVLGLAIERITGEKLEEVMHQRVFKPIGMYDTVLRRSSAASLPNSAELHVLGACNEWKRTAWFGGIDGAGAGAIASTINDMLRWMAHMDAPRVGSTDTHRAMRTSQILSNGAATNYGLGLQLTSYRGIETVHHAGGVFGGNAQMLKVPAARLDVIVIVNRSDKSAIDFVHRVLDACLPALDPVPPTAAGPIATGLFRSETTGRVVQLLPATPSDATDVGQMASVDGHRLPMIPDSTGTLRIAGSGSFLTYAISLVGGPTSPSAIRLNDFGDYDDLTRVEPVVGARVGAVEGRYRSASIKTDVLITLTDKGARMDTVGRFGSAVHHLECLAHDIWRSSPDNELALPPWSILCFSEDFSSFRFSNVLTRNLCFRRIS